MMVGNIFPGTRDRELQRLGDNRLSAPVRRRIEDCLLLDRDGPVPSISLRRNS